MTKKARTKTLYICDSCGAEYLQWQGRCDACQSWNTLKQVSGVVSGWSGTVSAGEQKLAISPLPLTDARIVSEERIVTDGSELDRVLGGGLVRGSLVLVSGDPGVGKSTLLLQAAGAIASRGETVVYVSGEESNSQIRARAERIGALSDQLLVTGTTDVSLLLTLASQAQPRVMIIDSVQTLFHPDFPSSPGSIVQLRESVLTISQLARRLNMAVIFIGHITKQGTIAGPKTLEHMVDVVLSFDARSDHSYRLLRVEKNRYGDASEVGVFAMETAGFIPIPDPSRYFLAERSAAAGSALTAVLEGARPLVLEIQALAHKSSFGYPKRAASGFDVNRLQLLLAILERHTKVSTGDHDVYINVVGGLKVREPAADLAVCAAILSSLKNQPLDEQLCLFGEVGLTGEIRQVVASQRRADTIKRLGYRTIPFNSSLAAVLQQVL